MLTRIQLNQDQQNAYDQFCDDNGLNIDRDTSPLELLEAEDLTNKERDWLQCFTWNQSHGAIKGSCYVCGIADNIDEMFTTHEGTKLLGKKCHSCEFPWMSETRDLCE